MESWITVINPAVDSVWKGTRIITSIIGFVIVVWHVMFDLSCQSTTMDVKAGMMSAITSASSAYALRD